MMQEQEKPYGTCRDCDFPALPLHELRGEVVVVGHNIAGGDDCDGCGKPPAELLTEAEADLRTYAYFEQRWKTLKRITE